jgi:hypothetical protein
MSSTQPKPGDMKAAFTGLVVGAVAVLAILYGVVQWTNSRFEGHAPAGATAPATTTTTH